MSTTQKHKYDEDGRNNRREIQEDYIAQKKHELFDELETKQVEKNAKYSLGSQARAVVMFTGILGVIVLIMFCTDFFRGMV